MAQSVCEKSRNSSCENANLNVLVNRHSITKSDLRGMICDSLSRSWSWTLRVERERANALWHLWNFHKFDLWNISFVKSCTNHMATVDAAETEVDSREYAKLYVIVQFSNLV
jgi:hypothetical protein